MRWLQCLIFGHRWFPTVIAHAEFDPDWERFDLKALGQFRERICLCCGKQEAVYEKTLDEHDFENAAYWGDPEPTWLGAEPRFFPLPGDW